MRGTPTCLEGPEGLLALLDEEVGCESVDLPVQLLDRLVVLGMEPCAQEDRDPKAARACSAACFPQTVAYPPHSPKLVGWVGGQGQLRILLLLTAVDLGVDELGCRAADVVVAFHVKPGRPVAINVQEVRVQGQQPEGHGGTGGRQPAERLELLRITSQSSFSLAWWTGGAPSQCTRCLACHCSSVSSGGFVATNSWPLTRVRKVLTMPGTLRKAPLTSAELPSRRNSAKKRPPPVTNPHR